MMERRQVGLRCDIEASQTMTMPTGILNNTKPSRGPQASSQGPSAGLRKLLGVTAPRPLTGPAQLCQHCLFCACDYSRWSE